MSRHLLITILVLALVSALFADVPRTISYQGRLTDNGIPVNGLKSVRFKIYDRSSNPIWNSGSVNVTFTEGLFTVELGQSPQPPLFVEGWSSDTAMSLGVTIAPNPELSPRLRFKTTPYAMHAMTAEWANFGGGWLHNNGLLRLEDPNDSIGIGTTTPHAKVAISTPSIQTALRINSDCPFPLPAFPAMELTSANVTGAIFRRGTALALPGTPRPAIYGESGAQDGIAAWFKGTSDTWAAIEVDGDGSGGAISASSQKGYALQTYAGKGIRTMADSATAIRAECYYGKGPATVFSSVYAGSAIHDHIAVSGYSRPADYYGVGGRFEGGWNGVSGVVYPDVTGNRVYTGVDGEVLGGAGTNYGVYGHAYGTGTNYGIYVVAGGGTENWAGYFGGDVRVVGNLYGPKATLSIDHPKDPENKFLQQAEVVSDNLSAVYSGNVILGSDGSATVQLPDYLESFCGDFRYQLTCVGGYAPVYVASKITNSRFTIAGGTPGLEVSWQVTGIRKDKYAQANPLEVEKKKTVSEQGKFLHPELFGYGAERSLSPNPERDASVKSKNDAIRAATAALTKPSAPPEQPQFMKK